VCVSGTGLEDGDKEKEGGSARTGRDGENRNWESAYIELALASEGQREGWLVFFFHEKLSAFSHEGARTWLLAPLECGSPANIFVVVVVILVNAVSVLRVATLSYAYSCEVLWIRAVRMIRKLNSIVVCPKNKPAFLFWSTHTDTRIIYQNKKYNFEKYFKLPKMYVYIIYKTHDLISKTLFL